MEMAMPYNYYMQLCKIRFDMKKALFFLFFNLLILNLFSQEWVGLGSDSALPPKVGLLSESEDVTVISFALEGFFLNKMETPRGLQNVVTVPKMASMLEKGSPDLPLYAIPVLIDDIARMDVEVVDSQYQDFQAVEIAPSKGNFSREINPDEVPFHYGEVYSQNNFFPDYQAQLDQPYILRDCRGQNILVYPFAYNPVTQTLRVFTKLTLSMKKSDDKGENCKKPRKVNRLTPETEAMYAQRFVNYREDRAKYNFIPDEGEIMVICADTYMEAIQPFVDWKNESGRPARLYSVTEVGGNNVDVIKSFIFSHYNSPDENLCYVLLVGDYADITPKSISGGCSDIWFGQLDGNDYYPEVFVGRFSAHTIEDVEHQVTKVIYYERDMPFTAYWLSKGIGIGSTEGAGSGHNGGESDYQHIEYIRDTLMHYTYTDVSQHYSGVGAGTNAAMLSEDFNAGVGICNYCNHGSQTSWYVGGFTNSHINALVNDYKWPFIWSTACLNGQFDMNCFAEAWMRATNNATGAPTGAIGGMFSWTSQPWQPPMTGQDEMVDILCEWRSADQYHHTLGGASLNGNMKILDMHPSDQGATHNTWILFGDPSLQLRTAQPIEMNVTCQPEAIFLGQTELSITADADFAVATLTNNGQIMCSMPVVNGEAVLTFDSPEEVGSAQLVVMGFNKVTHVQNIEIIPANGAFLTYGSHVVNSPSGQADYGETFDLSLSIKNIGNEAVDNVQVDLQSDSPYIEILDGSAIIPTLQPLEEYVIQNGFMISVADQIYDGIQVPISITCSDGIRTWNSSFRLTLHAPVFALTDFRPLGNVNPGEDGILQVSIRNTGSTKAHQARIGLYSSSTDISFAETEHQLGDIPSGDTATVQAHFSVDGGVMSGSSYEILYFVEADQYELEGTEFLNVGPIKETFETGDFSAFDWQTIGGAQWFVDNSTSNTGTYSARSGVITHANVTTLQITMDISVEGQISFFKKVCTEANKDKLTFYIDNAAKGEWSGEVNWSKETYFVTTGRHTFKWIYMKNGSGSYGDDCCWIDDVQFPATNIVKISDGPELEATVNGLLVSLSWEDLGAGYEYVIRCDGQYVTTVSGTTFSEWKQNGNYLYSVCSRRQHLLSAPSFAFVQVGIQSSEECMQGLEVYPNPTDNHLNVNFGRAFDYCVYNVYGQLVVNGRSDGYLQLNFSDKANGLYVLRLFDGECVMIKKIVVQ